MKTSTLGTRDSFGKKFHSFIAGRVKEVKGLYGISKAREMKGLKLISMPNSFRN